MCPQFLRRVASELLRRRFEKCRGEVVELLDKRTASPGVSSGIVNVYSLAKHPGWISDPKRSPSLRVVETRTASQFLPNRCRSPSLRSNGNPLRQRGVYQERTDEGRSFRCVFAVKLARGNRDPNRNFAIFLLQICLLIPVALGRLMMRIVDHCALTVEDAFASSITVKPPVQAL